MKTTTLINELIEKIPIGEPFASSEFLRFGSRANIDKILSRLVKLKTITRVARGIFVKQETIPYIGDVLPNPSKIAEMVARTSGETISIHGAEAARQLQLTTQMPTTPIFLTTGATRHIKVDSTEILLKHVASCKITNSKTIAGLVISALWYLGKKHVNNEIIDHVKNKLTNEQFQQVQSSISSMPGWMINAFYRYNRDNFSAR